MKYSIKTNLGNVYTVNYTLTLDDNTGNGITQTFHLAAECLKDESVINFLVCDQHEVSGNTLKAIQLFFNHNKLELPKTINPIFQNIKDDKVLLDYIVMGVYPEFSDIKLYDHSAEVIKFK
jgi:hypothetical protein